jgi:hypothetical protein
MTDDVERVAGSVAVPAQGKVPWRADSAWRVISLTPFGLALVLVLLALFAQSSVGGPMGKPPDILGIPLGIALDAVVLAWAALGARVIWTTRSLPMATIALLTTTGPAVVLLVLGPAIILILQNLSS